MRTVIHYGLLLFGVFVLIQCKQENVGCESGEMNIGSTGFGDPIYIDKLDHLFNTKSDITPYYVHEKFGEIRLKRSRGWI
tara:strand:+ start:43 stop:282 length:240 start_codon:yes stop_codon:yes gene_type:complete